MIDIDFTLIIQAINFIIMLWFLNRFIFQPVLKHVEAREAKVKEIEDGASDFVKRGEEAMAKYEQELSNIRHDASDTVSKARQEARERQNELIDGAKSEFRGMIDKARDEIKGEVDSASSSLNSEVDNFARSLTEKILGRKVS
jgi:F-type H+-transporting ATPase subunit b